MPISEQWLAGFFDGEGCIGITVAGKHRRCILRIYIVNTDASILHAIHEEFGGYLVKARIHKDKPHWKPFRAISWTNQQAVNLLGRIAPYIVLKSKQVELALEFLKLRDIPNRYESSSEAGIPRGEKSFAIRIKPKILEIEEQIKAQMHELNRKGIPIALQ